MKKLHILSKLLKTCQNDRISTKLTLPVHLSPITRFFSWMYYEWQISIKRNENSKTKMWLQHNNNHYIPIFKFQQLSYKFSALQSSSEWTPLQCVRTATRIKFFHRKKGQIYLGKKGIEYIYTKLYFHLYPQIHL